MVRPLRRRPLRLGNTTWALLGELTPLGSSSVLFFLLIALLPAEEYGLFVAITAVAFIVTPLARAGASIVMMRDLGDGGDEQRAWERALTALSAGCGLAVIGWAVFGRFVLPAAPFAVTLALYTQQLVPHAFSELCNSLLVAKLRMQEAFFNRATFAGWRIVGLVVFAVLRSDSLAVLAAILLLCGVLGVAQNLFRIRRLLGIESRLVRSTPATLARGVPDSFNSATGSVLDSVDRPILFNAGFEADTARYGVAMRIIGIAGVATIALLRPYDKALYRAGASSVDAAYRLMHQAAARTVPIGIASAVGLWLVAGFVPDLLPDDYAAAVDIIKWGVWMMPLRAVSFPYGNVLTAAGHRVTRLGMTAAAAIGNALANLVFIPTFSWKAAVVTTLAAEAFLAVGFVTVCAVLAGRERRTGDAPAAS